MTPDAEAQLAALGKLFREGWQIVGWDTSDGEIYVHNWTRHIRRTILADGTILDPYQSPAGTTQADQQNQE